MALNDNVDLKNLRLKLKSGEYDGNDVMHAWIAIEELEQLRCENLELIAFRDSAFDAYPNIDIDIETN